MNRKLEEKIRKEIRKRAFEHSDRLQQERQNVQSIQYTLDALQEVTGLPHQELEAIAQDVKISFEVSGDEFFSIKNQILMTFGVSALILILSWFVYII